MVPATTKIARVYDGDFGGFPGENPRSANGLDSELLSEISEKNLNLSTSPRLTLDKKTYFEASSIVDATQWTPYSTNIMCP